MKPMTSAESIQQMLGVAEALEVLKEDYTILSNKIQFDPQDGGMIIPSGLGPFVTKLMPDDWAWRQICEKIGPPTYKYIRQCPPELVAANLNYWAAQRPSAREWFIRSYNEPGSDMPTARAALSNRYGPISNALVLKAVKEIMEQGSITPGIVRPYLDRDKLHLRLTVPGGPNGYRMGVFIYNGETGNRMFGISPFILRTSCLNSLVSLENTFAMRHLKTVNQQNFSEGFITSALAEHVGQMLNVSAEGIDRMHQASLQEIPNISEVISNICKTRKWPDYVRDDSLMGTEGQATRLGLINGFTYTASHNSNLTEDARVEIEAVAGAILYQDGNPLTIAARSRILEAG